MAGAAFAATAAAIGKTIKDAVTAYADYEQLVGGVETLFKDSADKVQEYAANAYKTSGLSANEYMQNVTSFSASLLQSLGGDTAKAADVADMAMTDMADNANKMGTSMEAIQNAYQGFAKQNYTMLDNLKLGYGGTKSEMERLLADAEKFSGVHYDINNLNDVYQAIHVIQTELDITGTTAKEAASTIQGSTAMMKAAWSNLLVGLADDNADFGTLIGNFVDSATNTVKLIMPRITQALSGIGDLITGVVPIITDALPELIDTALPPLIDATKSLLKGVADAIPSILITAIQELPELVNAAIEILLSLVDGLTENLPMLIPAAVSAVLQIVTALTEPDTLVNLIDAALQLILALQEGLIQAIPQLIQAAPTIIINLVSALIRALPMVVSAGMQLINQFIAGFFKKVSALTSAGKDIVSQVGDAIKGALKGALSWGKDLVSNFIDGIKQGWQNLKKGVSDVAAGIAGFFHHSVPKYGPFKDELTWMPDFMQNMADGIRDNAYLVTDEMDKAFNFDSGIITGSPEITATVSGASATDTLLNQILSALGEMGVYIDGEKAGRLMAKGANVGMGQAYISTARRALA